MLFIVSAVELRAARSAGETDTPTPLHVAIERAEGTKCERCWRYVSSVSDAPERRGVCGRCLDALAEPVRS